jgi:hypothetical protein
MLRARRRPPGPPPPGGLKRAYCQSNVELLEQVCVHHRGLSEQFASLSAATCSMSGRAISTAATYWRCASRARRRESWIVTRSTSADLPVELGERSQPPPTGHSNCMSVHQADRGRGPASWVLVPSSSSESASRKCVAARSRSPAQERIPRRALARIARVRSPLASPAESQSSIRRS